VLFLSDSLHFNGFIYWAIMLSFHVLYSFTTNQRQFLID